MPRIHIAIAVISLFLWGSPQAYGQKATEIFIPIGKSPGLSGVSTVIGTVATVNAQEQTMTLRDAAGSHEMKLSEQTWIWQDRSEMKLPNQLGTFEDCREGRLVEVKYETSEGQATAEWIKVRITAPN